MRKIFLTLSAASLALTAGMAAAADTDQDKAKLTEFQNATGAKVKIYGQLTPTFQSFDDGEKTYSDLADNSNSNSRIGLDYEQQFGASTFTFKFETALGFPQSGAYSQDGNPSLNWTRENIRHVDAALAGSYGKFSAGQGSMATDGLAGRDLSGTDLAGISAGGSKDSAGGFFINGDLTDASVGLYGKQDGERLGRVRYDTPAYAGFSVAVAAGRNILTSDVEKGKAKHYDLALNYANSFGDTQVVGGLGFLRQDKSDGNTVERTMGSASVLFGNGINVTVAAGEQKNGGKFNYAKLGYRTNLISMGETAIAVDVYNGKDFLQNQTTTGVVGDKGTFVGVGVVQQIDSLNMEAYAAYRHYDLKADNASFKDANVVLVGGRWKF